MVGDEAAKLRNMLQITYPIDNGKLLKFSNDVLMWLLGIIRNWDDMQYVWDYTFYEKLKVNPADCKVRIILEFSSSLISN